MSTPRIDANDPKSPPGRRPGRGAALAWAATTALAMTHTWVIWIAMGGWGAISNPWPLAVHDHPTYFHSALVTRHFLGQNGTTAGYDPAFMAGYPKSIVFPASSTLWEVLFLIAGPSRPELTYKLGMLAFLASLPWLVAAAGAILRLGPWAIAAGVGWYLNYIWNDFPINYAYYGMVPYLLAMPVGLLTTAVIARFLDRGGLDRALAATAASTIVVMIHFTSVMIVVPAVLATWIGIWLGARRVGTPVPRGRFFALIGIALIAVALNAFWWLPGPFLASTKGASDFVFAEKDASLFERLGRIVGREPRIQLTLWILGPVGLIALARKDRLAASALAGFAAAGFGWGYASGVFRSLDFLQAGRHTYALYPALAIGAGYGVSEFVAWIDRRGGLTGLLAALVLVGLAVAAFWAFGLQNQLYAGYTALGIAMAAVVAEGISRIARKRRSWAVAVAFLMVAGVVFEFWIPSGRVFGPIVASRRAFLTSEPTPQFLWIVNRIKAHVRPGERLLYEEGGFEIQGLADPFHGGRFSGLLPHYTGVEVLGGPYLHAALQENFTQFGEGKLFGRMPWDEKDFRRYAQLYRPAAIVCWTPWSRKFCYDHPELIEVKEDDGRITIGRVKGFEGPTIRGKAEVIAEPGRLRVRPISAELDGLVVLRYHFVPCLRSRPEVPLVPVFLEDDPVPFLGLRPTAGEVSIEMGFPP